MALPGEAPTSLFSFFFSWRASPWRASLLALALASAETGLGPSDPKDEAGEGAGTGLDVPGWGGGGGGGAIWLSGVEGVSLVVTLPDLVVYRTLWRPVMSLGLLAFLLSFMLSFLLK